MVAGVAVLEGSDGAGVGDDPGGEGFCGDGGDGEADAIESDGAFVDDVFEEWFGNGGFEEKIGAALLEGFNLGEAIDVAGDEVAVHAAIDGERALEVYASSGLSKLEVGKAPGFAEEIELEERFLFGAFDFDDGEAATVDGQAITDFGALSGKSGLELEPNGFFRRLDGRDDSAFFDDAGEHG